MSRINLMEAENFQTNNGGIDFLSLANDKDSAMIQFAYASMQDIPVYLIHNIKGEDNSFKSVGCLRVSANQPLSVCPLCEAGIRLTKSLYFNVYNINSERMEIWNRSEAFFRRNLLPIFSDYEAEGVLLHDIPFKIIRNGVKGDLHTTYTVLPQQIKRTNLENLPNLIDVEESGLVKNYDMEILKQIARDGYVKEDNSVKEEPKQNNFTNAPNNRRTIINNGGL